MQNLNWKKLISKQFKKKYLYMFVCMFIIWCSLICVEASENYSVYYYCNNGKISIENGEPAHLYLQYDDYYSFKNAADSTVYNNYAIVELKSSEIRSYKVSNGKVTTKDSTVLEHDNKNYELGLHATGVGTAQVLLVKRICASIANEIINGTYTGSSINIIGKRVTVTVNPARLTVMLLTGQSNMSGSSDTSGNHPENSIVCPRGQVYSTYPPATESQFRRYTGLQGEAATVDNMSSYIAGSINQYANAINGSSLLYQLNSLTADGKGKTGPDSGLAYEYNKLSGDKIWVINTACGSSHINDWNPKGTESGPMWLRTKAAYKLAAKTYEAEIKANHFIKGNTLVFWLQGEADHKNDADYYQSGFNSLYNAMESLVKPDYWGIIAVRAVGTPTTKADIAMTGPRISQRYMTGCYSKKYENVYMASDVNELWITNTNVSNYFKETYPKGYLDYPLRSNASIKGSIIKVGVREKIEPTKN